MAGTANCLVRVSPRLEKIKPIFFRWGLAEEAHGCPGTVGPKVERSASDHVKRQGDFLSFLPPIFLLAFTF